MSVLSDRLRELRGPQSQAEMAKPLGIVYQQWAKYERGESAPGSELLAKICKIHSCSADWLLGIKEISTVSVNATNGATVAVGTGAKASSTAFAPMCKTCQYKKVFDKLKKAGMTLA